MLRAMSSPASRRAAAFALATAALATPSLASANGRYPAAGQIALDPSDANALLVRATYGLLLTKNQGQRWDWICEGAVGFNSAEDPMVSFTADGTLLAGIFEGLSTSTDHGCTWGFAGGALANHYVVDLAVDKVDPTKGVLVISNNAGVNDAGVGVYLGQLWQTSDSGKTWAQAGTNLPDQLLGLTVDTAPSDPNRVYVSGRMGPPDYKGVLQRSDDRGATWQELPIPGSDDKALPYIGAIDPNDPDVIYVRLDSSPGDHLVVSKDGGHTWSSAFDTTGDMLGFALSPDGATVAVGGPKDGLWTAPSSTLSFTKVASVGALCLTWAQAGLYACGDEFIDGFVAGLSTDQGKTFTPLMHLQGLCGPLACDSGSSVATQCTMAWPATAATIGATGCGGTDGGAGGGGSGGSGAGGGGGTGGSADEGGCAVVVPAAGASMMSAAALLGLVALGLRRRRR
jgi:MYXO-CTERM domain-containing protein